MPDVQQRFTVHVCGGEFDVPERECATAFQSVSAVPGGGHPDGHRVDRFLPSDRRRLVSAFCLIDRIGPIEVGQRPWIVDAHPHLGLQVLSFVMAGRLEQQDSLGNHAVLEPGQFSMFTSGGGASHLERTPAGETGHLHALQLWLVLPELRRNLEARHLHVDEPPLLTLPGLHGTVLAGNLAGVSSPVHTYSPVVAAVVTVEAGAGHGSSAWLPLVTRNEYAVVPLSGEFTLNGSRVAPDTLQYLGWHRDGIDVESTVGGSFLLIGGEPFTEQFQLWWNLAATRYEDLVAARTLWNAHSPMFGRMPGAIRATTPVMPPRRAIR